MSPKSFRTLFAVLHNLNLDQLEKAGVITKGAKGGSDWKRFNDDLTTFILKLRQENLEALFDLVRRRMPASAWNDAITINRDIHEA
jgi:hypothetical protein